MARKNHRVNEAPPEFDDGLVDTIGISNALCRERYETEDERDNRIRAENERRRFRTERRADERIAQQIDWRKCCVPGCDASSSVSTTFHPKKVTECLPVCQRHEAIITKQVQPYWHEVDYVAMRDRLARQRVVEEIAQEREEDLLHESGGHKQGQIYFVRLGGLIKVGWASKLRSRLKSYGASAEILCHFPASRSDETNLHRNLRPYLAKGREWYQDCKLIGDVIDGYVKQYGTPTILPAWTVPKKDVICKRSV